MAVPRTRVFSRVFLSASLLHAFASVVAFAVLLDLTRGGGEGFRDSAAIEAAAAVLKTLALPASWPVERMLDPGRDRPPALGVLVALRLMNSVVVGAIVAALWTALRRPVSAGAGARSS